jgi:hypothetical protein
LECDDEAVKKMVEPKFQASDYIEILNEDEHVAKKRKKLKTSYSSSSAYLLVYQKRSKKLKRQPRTPPNLESIVDEDNKLYSEQEEKAKQIRKQRIYEMRARVDSYRSLQNEWESFEDAKNLLHCVSAEALRRAIKLDYEAITVDDSRILTQMRERLTIDNSLIQCVHGKIKPSEIAKTKRFPPNSYSILKEDLDFNITPEFLIDDICHDCVALDLKEQVNLRLHESDLESFNRCPKQAINYFISKSWLNGLFY